MPYADPEQRRLAVAVWHEINAQDVKLRKADWYERNKAKIRKRQAKYYRERRLAARMATAIKTLAALK